MAIFKGPYYEHWRSNHHGIEGQKNIGSPSFRKSHKYRGYGSPKQSKIKQDFSDIHLLWKNLSVDDQDEWNLFGSNFPTIDKYGEELFLPGYHWFLKLNTRLKFTDKNPILLPPSNDIPDYNPTTITTQSSPGQGIVVNTSPQPPIGAKLVCYRNLNSVFSRRYFGTDIHFYSHFSNTDSYPFVVANSEELQFNNTVSYFRYYGIDSYGRIGDYRSDYVYPVG